MSETSGDRYRTRLSLLIDVSEPSNHAAWDAFIERYRPMIRGWCRHWVPNAADEMSCEVLTKLVFVMRTYQYKPDGRFRSWLKTVTHRLMAELKRDNDRYRSWGDAEYEIAAGVDLEARLAADFDLELLERARENVRGRVEARTWTAYVETAEKGREPAEVAQGLGMKVGAVYQAKSSVLKALKLEVEILEN